MHRSDSPAENSPPKSPPAVPAEPPPVGNPFNVLRRVVDKLDWESLCIVSRHLELLMEAMAPVQFLANHSPRNLRDLRSQKLMKVAQKLSGFTGDIAELTVAVEVFIW